MAFKDVTVKTAAPVVAKTSSSGGLANTLGSTITTAKGLGIDTTKAQSVFDQTKAQGATPFAGSSFDVPTTAPSVSTPTKTPTPTVFTPKAAVDHINNVVIPAMTTGNANIANQNAQNAQNKNITQLPGETRAAYDARLAGTKSTTPTTTTPTTTPHPTDIPEAGQQWAHNQSTGEKIQLPLGQPFPEGYAATPPANPVLNGKTVVSTPVQGLYGETYQQYSDGSYGKLDINGNFVGAVSARDFSTAQANDPATVAANISKSLASLTRGAVPLNEAQTAQINALDSQLTQDIAAQTQANANYTGAMTVMQNLYGMGNAASGIGMIKATVDAGVNAIANLQTKAAASIAAMTDAFQKENYAEMRDHYKDLQANNDGIQAHIDKIRTEAESLRKDQQARLDVKDAQINQISVEAAKVGGLTPQQQDALKLALANHDVSGAINAVGNSLQTATGQLGDFLQYRRDTQAKGLVPQDYATWKAKDDARIAKEKSSEAYSTAYASAAGRVAAEGNFSNSDKNQQKLEQQYRGVLSKELSSRSGALGTENGKVNQANHLNSLITQYYDPKTGQYNIPTSQYAELAIGLANLVAPNGTTAEADRAQIKAFTAKSDLSGALQYITGQPQTGNTQDMIKNLVDSVDRQAETATRNREAALQNMRDMAPTDLNPSRIDALNKSTDMVHYEGKDRIAKTAVENFIGSSEAKSNLSSDIKQKASAMSGGKNFNTPGELAIYLGGLPGGTPEKVFGTLQQLGLAK